MIQRLKPTSNHAVNCFKKFIVPIGGDWRGAFSKLKRTAPPEENESLTIDF